LEVFINKGERVKKSRLASLKRKTIKIIKEKRLTKLYRELRKARKNS
tara:strand:- start:5225 stop:5365 length:141 start_codon:yes stop_codon:yes gene_type:complete